MIGMPANVRIVRAEPFEDDETDDVNDFPACVLADWIVRDFK